MEDLDEPLQVTFRSEVLKPPHNVCLACCPPLLACYPATQLGFASVIWRLVRRLKAQADVLRFAIDGGFRTIHLKADNARWRNLPRQLEKRFQVCVGPGLVMVLGLLRHDAPPNDCHARGNATFSQMAWPI